MTSENLQDGAQLDPPEHALHPLHLLDRLLGSPNNDDTGFFQNPSAAETENKILRVLDYLYANSSEAVLGILDDADETIRKVCATPSKRTAFLVRGTTAAPKKRTAATYLCLAGGHTWFCSCRSFFERAKSDPKALCKHLLALKIMPHLEVTCSQTQVPDMEYTNMLVDQVFACEHT